MNFLKEANSSSATGWRLDLPAGFQFKKINENWCIATSIETCKNWLKLNQNSQLDNSPLKALDRIMREMIEETVKNKSYLCKEPTTVLMHEINLGQTTDKATIMNYEFVEICHFIHTIVADANLLGRITAAALLSKLFMHGFFKCEKIIFIIGMIDKWSKQEQEIVQQTVLEGFQQTVLEINAKIQGSVIFESCTCMFGGYISMIRSKNLYNFSNNSIPGDVLILTKPLGTQLAIKAFQLLTNTEQCQHLCKYLTENKIQKAYNDAIKSMTELNLRASMLLASYEVRALTEINGKSFFEHVQKLAEQQINQVSFFIYNLPVIENTLIIAEALSEQAEFIQGNLTEYSGGLLTIMPLEHAIDYCQNLDNGLVYAGIIGNVGYGNRKADILKYLSVIECANFNKKD